MKKKLTKLVIDRRRWLRGGSPSASSYLLHPINGKMCCLGFAAVQVGAQPKHIRGEANPYDVPGTFEATAFGWLIRRRAFDNFPGHTQMCHRIILTNDDGTIEDDERERSLKKLFRKKGVVVKFIN